MDRKDFEKNKGSDATTQFRNSVNGVPENAATPKFESGGRLNSDASPQESGYASSFQRTPEQNRDSSATNSPIQNPGCTYENVTPQRGRVSKRDARARVARWLNFGSVESPERNFPNTGPFAANPRGSADNAGDMALDSSRSSHFSTSSIETASSDSKRLYRPGSLSSDDSTDLYGSVAYDEKHS